jgi:hypothetical protein
LVTLQRQSNAFGYFANGRFENREDRSTTDEIALNPKHIVERPPAETLSTLVHEMVHLKQHHFGNPGRGRYHNKQWADWMSDIGLEPTNTGNPGGKRTGDPVTHYIVEGGAFDRAAQAFLAKNEGLVWGDRLVDPKTGGKRSKYICPEDKLAAWARPGIRLICGEHEGAGVPMVEQKPKPV